MFTGEDYKSLVRSAFDDIENFTCVRFVKRSNEPDYLQFLNDAGYGFQILLILNSTDTYNGRNFGLSTMNLLPVLIFNFNKKKTLFAAIFSPTALIFCA